MHFYQNSIPPCKGILRCVARLLYHIFEYVSIRIANIVQHKKTAQHKLKAYNIALAFAAKRKAPKKSELN